MLVVVYPNKIQSNQSMLLYCNCIAILIGTLFLYFSYSVLALTSTRRIITRRRFSLCGGVAGALVSLGGAVLDLVHGGAFVVGGGKRCLT